eukprot:10142986-Lingulodinium_polyedra.AAC.1
MAGQRSVPELARCTSALLAIVWQNDSVERDFAVVTEVERRSDGHLGMWRLSSSCRAAIEGPAPPKAREGR